MQQTTKIALAWELFQEGSPKIWIASHLGVNRRTIRRWIFGIQEKGDLEGFIDGYLLSKKGPRAKRKVDGYLKALIYKIREEEKDCCGQKIQYFLKEDYGIDLSVTAIYKILSERFKLRSKWKKNQKRGPVPEAKAKREVIQMDTVDFGEVFAFSGVDIFSREADVLLRPSLTGRDGYLFLKISMERRFEGYSDLIQTDGGPEYKDEFEAHVLEYSQRHRVARPYKKNEQAFIESFNRSLRKECLGWGNYKRKELPILQKEVDEYLKYYHERRPHLGLGMRPPLKVYP